MHLLRKLSQVLIVYCAEFIYMISWPSLIIEEMTRALIKKQRSKKIYVLYFRKDVGTEK